MDSLSQGGTALTTEEQRAYESASNEATEQLKRGITLEKTWDRSVKEKIEAIREKALANGDNIKALDQWKSSWELVFPHSDRSLSAFGKVCTALQKIEVQVQNHGKVSCKSFDSWLVSNPLILFPSSNSSLNVYHPKGDSS